MIEVVVSADPAATAAERLAAAAERGGHVALAGGSTPRGAYEIAAGLVRDWSRCELWLGDERCVPADHEDSNHRMVREALIERAQPPPPVLHEVDVALGAHGAAAAYERRLAKAFGPRGPVFDLVLLGLGRDAHTASLFPNAPALREQERMVVGVDVPGEPPPVPRVTLTLPAINAAREVVFLATGSDKADAAGRAFGTESPDEAVPASLVRPASGRLAVVLDEAAARELPRAQVAR